MNIGIVKNVKQEVESGQNIWRRKTVVELLKVIEELTSNLQAKPSPGEWIESQQRISQLENDAAQWNTIRIEVQRFAFAMEERLKANDHKGGWENEPVEWLLKRLRQEVAELEQAISYRKKLIGEAADVANFCMMIADVEGSLM